MLRCPACGGELTPEEGKLTCRQSACGKRYPVADGVPVLIDESSSLVCIGDLMPRAGAAARSRKSLVDAMLRRLPSLTHNLKAAQNYRKLRGLLLKEKPNPQGVGHRLRRGGGGDRCADRRLDPDDRK